MANIKTKKASWVNGTLKTPNLRLTVTNRHIYNPDQWVLNVRELGWSCVSLGISISESEEKAQELAEEKVKDYLNKLLKELS